MPLNRETKPNYKKRDFEHQQKTKKTNKKNNNYNPPPQKKPHWNSDVV